MGDKRKPWEETWHAVDSDAFPASGEERVCRERYEWPGYTISEAGPFTFSPSPDHEGWNTDCGHSLYGLPKDVATLAAAAPDLVRALLAVEWIGMHGYECEIDGCVWCGGIPESVRDSYFESRKADGGFFEEFIKPHARGHRSDCPRQAALRKAGVLG